MKILYLVFIALVVVVSVGCSSGDEDAPTAVPAFLDTAFIELTSDLTATTYDFTQVQAAGRRTMAIRNWQRIGTLGWQSFQAFTADFEATEEYVAFVSPTGFEDTWIILEVQPQGMVIRDIEGFDRTLLNCLSAGWPALIHASTRACN